MSCEKCGSTMRQEDLEEHQRHGQCEDCETDFQCSNALSEHHLERLFVDASVCDLVDEVEQEGHWPEYTLTCRSCNIECQDKDSFIEHICVKSHHLAPLSVRPKTKDYFTTTRVYLRRMKDRDPSTVTFICHVCASVYETLQQLKKHMLRMHLGHNYKTERTARDFPCPSCQVKLPLITRYVKHVQEEHDSVFTCPFCLAVSPHRYHLTNHVLTCPVFQGSKTLERMQEERAGMEQECASAVKMEVGNNGDDDAEGELVRGPEDGEVRAEDVPLTQPRTGSTCTHCQKLFNAVGSVRRHKKICLGVLEPAKCRYCEEVFTSKTCMADCIKHEKANHCAYSCNACGMIFQKKCDRDHHVIRNHPERVAETDLKVYVCTECSKHFVSLTLLKVHMISHMTDQEAVCLFCGEEFPAKEDLLEHHKQEHAAQSQKRCECEICGKTFTRAFGLREHMKRAHGDSSEVYKCEHCGKGFRSRPPLRGHIEREHLKVEVRCEICQKQLGSRNSLYNHMKLHDKKTRHECPHCGRTFSLAQHMKQHVRINHQKPQFECEICRKGFATSSLVKRHLDMCRRKHQEREGDVFQLLTSDKK